MVHARPAVVPAHAPLSGSLKAVSLFVRATALQIAVHTRAGGCGRGLAPEHAVDFCGKSLGLLEAARRFVSLYLII